MNRMQTKALVEGAIFAGVTALLGIIYYYTQYLGIIAMVWPVPVIIVGYRNGLKASILSAMSAGLIVSLLTQPLVGVGLLLGFGIPGILMGYMINKRVNPYIVVAACGVVLSLTMVGQFLLSLQVSGISFAQFLTSIDAAFKQSSELTMNLYRGLGIPEKDLQNVSSYINQSVAMMKLIFPALLVISGLIFSFIDYKLTRLVLKRIGYTIPDIEEFSRWRMKEPFSLILLGLAVLSGAAAYFKFQGAAVVAANISTALSMVFSVIGLSVIAYYSKVYGDRHGVPRAIRNTIVVFIVLAFMQFIALLGILDLVLNFRKLESKGSGGVR